MAYIGTNTTEPETSRKIARLMNNLLVRLQSEEPDVKVNAVCRLAVAYLATSSVTRQQADKLFKALLDSVDSSFEKDN